MSVRSHPSRALLAAYADGSLLTVPGLPVAAHLAACPRCAAEVRGVEEAQGEALAAAVGADMAPGALERALAAIETARPPPPPPPSSHGLPAAIAGARVGWKLRFPHGVWMAPIRAQRREGWRALLLHGPAGAVLPVHDHAGDEFTYVIEGAYVDRDALYAQGDFASADPSVRGHRLVVTSEGACTCLIALQGPVRCRPPLSFIAPLIGL